MSATLEALPTLNTKEAWNAWVRRRDPQPPERVSRRAYRALGDAARAEYDQRRKAWHVAFPPIAHPDHRYILEELRDLAEDNRLSAQPSAWPGALIDAGPTLGKSTTLRYFGRRYHRDLLGSLTDDDRPDELDDFVPVAHIDLDGANTIKMLDAAIAAFYGLGTRRSDTIGVLRHAVVEAAVRCRTTLFLFDEFHNVNPNRKDHRDVQAHIKWLSNEIPATFVFAGVNCAHLLDEGQGREKARQVQLRGRIQRYRLEPFAIDDDEERRAWVSLVNSFSARLVLLDDPSELWQRHWRYLHVRTGGSIGLLRQLVRTAANRAIRRGSGRERLTQRLLDGVNLPVEGEEQAARRGFKPHGHSRGRPAMPRDIAPKPSRPTR
jgi:hypothetical protein